MTNCLQDAKYNNMVICKQVTAHDQYARTINTNTLNVNTIIVSNITTDVSNVVEIGRVELEPTVFLVNQTEARVRKWGNFVEFTIDGLWAGPVIGPPANPPQVLARILDFFPQTRVIGVILVEFVGIATDRLISVETDGTVLNRIVTSSSLNDPAKCTLTWMVNA
jgi:hypothetical protein